MENLSGRIFLNEHHGSRFFWQQTDSFCALQLFSDELLAPEGVQPFEAPANTSVVLIPITGDLIYKDSLGGNEMEVNVGQILIISSPIFLNFQISNPFAEHEINYLRLTFKNQSLAKNVTKVVLDFDLGQASNNIVDITTAIPCRISIGQFEGRKDALYALNNSGFFCFVLSGAFEVQGRLLHAKDGLALWNIQEVELEALSNNAVVLTLELPYICL